MRVTRDQRRRLNGMRDNGGKSERTEWELLTALGARQFRASMENLRLLGLVVPCEEDEYELTPLGWDVVGRPWQESVIGYQDALLRERRRANRE